MNDETDIKAEAEGFLKDFFLNRNMNLSFASMPKNTGEISVLGLLAYNDGKLTSGDISKRLKLKTARVAAILRTLEEKGEIVRRQSDEDKRIVEVCLTQMGQMKCSSAIARLTDRISDCYREFGADEMNHFKDMLIRVYKIMGKEKRTCCA